MTEESVLKSVIARVRRNSERLFQSNVCNFHRRGLAAVRISGVFVIARTVRKTRLDCTQLYLVTFSDL